jgi:hypothetical protein
VIVLSGLDETISWLKSENWWGEKKRDEPIRFVLGAADQASAKKLRADIEAMRKSGKLTQIIERMRLE